MALGEVQGVLWEVACPQPPSGPTLLSHTPWQGALCAQRPERQPEHPAGGTAKVRAQQRGFRVGSGVQGGKRGPGREPAYQPRGQRAGTAEPATREAGLRRPDGPQAGLCWGRRGSAGSTEGRGPSQRWLPSSHTTGPSSGAQMSFVAHQPAAGPGMGARGPPHTACSPQGPGRQVGGPPSPPQEACGTPAQAAGAEAARTAPRPTANAGNWRQDFFLGTWNPAAHDGPGAGHGAPVQRVGAPSARRTLPEGPAPSPPAAGPASALPPPRPSAPWPQGTPLLTPPSHLKPNSLWDPGSLPRGPRTRLTPPARKGPHARAHSRWGSRRGGSARTPLGAEGAGPRLWAGRWGVIP